MKLSPGRISDWVKAPNGDVIFVDELNHRILVEDARGALRAITAEFRYPCSVAVLGSLVYVVDSWNHRVRAFDLPAWKLAFEFGSFFCPSSIAVVNGQLIVADTNNRRLSFHKPEGSCILTYELTGSPKRVDVNSDGNLVVHYEDGESETLYY